MGQLTKIWFFCNYKILALDGVAVSGYLPGFSLLCVVLSMSACRTCGNLFCLGDILTSLGCYIYHVKNSLARRPVSCLPASHDYVNVSFYPSVLGVSLLRHCSFLLVSISFLKVLLPFPFSLLLLSYHRLPWVAIGSYRLNGFCRGCFSC